ncbi:hypothetical protein T484DRAFT_1760294, partial [Baffinella frigidus]
MTPGPGGDMGDILPAVQLGEGRSAVSLTIGALSSCALLDDASVKCWGQDTMNFNWGDGSN